MNYLLDTCVISELIAKAPNERVVKWIDSQEDERLFLSVITIGEIQRGIARLSDSQRKYRLQVWLRDWLFSRFQNRILDVTLDVMLCWGDLTAQGRTLPAINSLIAALALHHDFYLVTRNVKDFEGTGVKIVDPWQE